MKLSSINLSTLLPEADLTGLYDSINDTASDYPRDKSIGDIFREVAIRQPGKTAVVLGDDSISFGELDGRSNQVANWLLVSGIQPEDVVGVYMNRTIPLIVTLFGILKAGAAYLPLNTENPADRSRHMLEQGGAVILIGEQVFIREINELQWTCPRLRSVLCIDSPHFYSSLEQANPLMKKELWEYVGETAEDDIAGGGWKSSYTGEKFSREVMDEYAANAFLKLKPYLNLSRSVLEIGCASGITMYKVAPEVKSYTGTDLSASIIEFNRLKCAETGVGNITLACMGADEIDQLEPQRFDIIVINSVIQAFNGLNYLRRIIGKAFRLLNDDGILFIGDVMDLDSRDRLLRSVRAYKLANPEANTKLDFSNELFVARGFFRDCIAEFHGISAVEVSPKLHTIANELTEFRYDVLLRKGQTVEVSKSKQQSGAITLEGFPSDPPPVKVGSRRLSNVMFTSGSTGLPKAVLIEHRSLVRLALGRFFPGVVSSDRWLQTAEISFDPSCMEIFATLLNGATLCLAPKEMVLDSEALQRYMTECRISILQLVSALFHTLAAQNPAIFRNVRKLIVGGEVLSPQLVGKVKAACPGIRIVNAYGPTENCVVSTAFEIDNEYEVLPIGRPIADSGIYILNQAMQLQPVGVVGELYLKGDGLARGYLGATDRDAQKFMEDPFRPGERVYRTGDLARLRPDHHIEFMGRKDAQVKINGHRVELPEIESVLKSVLNAAQVVVMMKGSPAALCAWYTGSGAVDEKLVGQLLAERIPAHMIPRYLVYLESFPVTSNGKIAVDKLPEPVTAAGAAEELVSPVGELENKLAAIFQEVLGKEAVGATQNFFRIGGHSLLATQVLSRINKQLGTQLRLKSIFNFPTVSGLAEEIGRVGVAAVEEIGPAPSESVYALSHAQERLWVLDHLPEYKSAYTISDAYRFRGPLQREALGQAFMDLIGRHEILRTLFTESEGNPVQKILDAGASGFHLAWEDIRGEQDKERRALDWVNNEAARPFDLEAGPLLRAAVLRLDEEEHIFLLSMHHIIGDGWSLWILIKELSAFYNARLGEMSPDASPAAALAPLSIQYKDYAAWHNRLLQGSLLEKLKGYWTRQLHGPLPQLQLPLDFPRSTAHSTRADKVQVSLPAEVSAGLRQLCQDENATLFMCLTAILYTLLYRYSGQTDILIGTPIAGRNHKDLENQIGLYLNTLALRTHLRPEMPFDTYLRTVKDTTLDAYEHQLYPFDSLVEDLNIPRIPNRSPLFDIGFTWQNIEGPESQNAFGGIKDIGIEHFGYDYKNVKTDIWIHGWEEDNGRISLSVSYNVHLFAKSTINEMIRNMADLAAAVASSPRQPIEALIATVSLNERKNKMENSNKSNQNKLDKFLNLKKRSVDLGKSLVGESTFPGQAYPVIIKPAMEGVILRQWVEANKERIQNILRHEGAVLFRGFDTYTMEAFQEIASALSSQKMSYIDQSSPRTLLSDKTYTSTDHPEDQVINMHNELSYSHDWPMQILFFCQQPAATGGATPIADSRKVLRSLSEEARRKFEEKGILYVRCLVKGFGLSWQEVYQTEDRARMESYCKERNILFEWVGADNLRISWKRPAVQVHPYTGEKVWFNHGFFFNAINLDESIHQAVGSKELLPFNTYYGDGTEIEKETLAELREAYAQAKNSFNWQRGDILLLDNMLISHGRDSYTGDRKILVAMNDPFSQQKAELK